MTRLDLDGSLRWAYFRAACDAWLARRALEQLLPAAGWLT